MRDKPFQEFMNEKTEVFQLTQDKTHGTLFWDTRAREKSFTWKQSQRGLIEQEFEDLFAVLTKYDNELKLIEKKLSLLRKKNNTQIEIQRLEARQQELHTIINERRDFWLPCYYYAKLLQSYNQAHESLTEAKQYQDWCDEIAKRIASPTSVEEKTKKAWMDKLLEDLANLASTPVRVSKIIDWVSFANIYRIHTVFCRLTAKTFLLFLDEKKLLDELKALLGMEIDASVLDVPTPVYNALSVGLFAIRLFINIGIIAKHVFVPSDEERDGEHWYDHAYDRFIAELQTLYCTMLNDVVWMSVNGFSNYAQYFKLSSAFANGLTLGFLCFDVALLAWRRRIDELAYLTKKEQYLQELGVDSIDAMDKSTLSSAKKVVYEQLLNLEDQWSAKSARYWFNIAAATVLVASFGSVLLFSAPAIVPICFLMVTLGVAMYLSDGSFHAYQKKRNEWLRLSADPSCTPEYLELIEQELQQKWFDFWITLIKNATIPLFITAAFTVSVPFALLSLGLYITYENGQKYFDHPERLAAAVVVIGALAINWPLALMAATVYAGYEAGAWLFGSKDDELTAPAVSM